MKEIETPDFKISAYKEGELPNQRNTIHIIKSNGESQGLDLDKLWQDF